MNKERLELIVQNLESLVSCLKSEIYSYESKESYKESKYEEIAPYLEDYDEVFYDDEV